MRTRISGIIICALAGALQAQTLDLRGRVVQANGTPVADATVELKRQGGSKKTGADGTFAFTGNVGLAPVTGLPFEYRLDPRFLSIQTSSPQDLRIEVRDGAGRLLGGLARRLVGGHHRIALAEAMPASGANAGLYILRMQLGGDAVAHPFLHSGNGSAGTVFAPAYRVALAKRSAAVDTLLIRKTGFPDLIKEVASYTAGNLGDLALPGAAGSWVNIFNGTDLTGWVPLIHKSKVNENTFNTFRVDSLNKSIKVAYDQYPNLSFDGRCGNLFYNKFLTNYRVRVTYRFSDPQAKNPVGWGHNNSGLMIFGIDPAKVTGDPQFPPIIEIQLLGSPTNPGGGGTTSPNYCEPNGIKMKVHTADCGDNHTGKVPNPAGTWTTVEAEVHVNDVTKVFQLPDTTKPVFTMSGPTYNNQPVTGGYLALQSESQPIEFKDILLMELPK